MTFNFWVVRCEFYLEVSCRRVVQPVRHIFKWCAILNFLTILEPYQPIPGSSDLSNPLQRQKKVCGGGWGCSWVKTKFIVLLRSKSLSFEFSELDFAWFWPSWSWPDPHLTWAWQYCIATRLLGVHIVRKMSYQQNGQCQCGSVLHPIILRS